MVSRLSVLVKQLASHEPNTRAAAALALGELKDPRAFEPLAAALGDPSLDVRGAVALALGRLKDPRAVERLAPLVEDPSASVREKVARALKDLGVDPHQH